MTATLTRQPRASGGTGTFAARPAATTVPDGFIYFASDDNGGTAYRSNGTAWSKLGAGALETGGRRLGLTQMSSSFTATALPINTDSADIMTGSWTVGARPVVLRAVCPTMQHSVANATIVLRLYEGSTQLQQSVHSSPPTANRGFPGLIEVPLSPSAGDHTYRLVARTSTDAGNIVITGAAVGPAHLVLVEQ